MFKRHVLVFACITLLALGTVIYFSFSRTVIAVTPTIQSETFSTELHIVNADTVKDSPSTIGGTLLAHDVHFDTSTTDFTKTSEVDGKATGQVTIHNTSSHSQPLQAGTRLLSETGILFRTASRVDVNAGTTTEVTVIADLPGQQGDIGPSHFEIVALWQGLKSQIYGESTSAFTGGTQKITILTEEDLHRIRTEGQAGFEERAREILQQQLQTALTPYSNIAAISISEPTESVDAKVGDTVTSVMYRAEGNSIGIAVNEEEFNDAIQRFAEDNIGPSFRIVDIPADDLSVAVTASNASAGTATLAIHGTIRKLATINHELFDHEHLTNKSRQDIESYFDQFDEIESVNVEFSPFWVIRTPNLSDHIEVKIIDPAAQ